MQLSAHTSEGKVVTVEQAERGCDYRCAECGGVVRVREGVRRQRHYYHLSRAIGCRQSGKGAIHLQVQHYLLRKLPAGEASMEVRFPTIGRIADVAWPAQQIVFEVQCAAMRPEEALARTEDYRSIGWQVIWILHAHRYRLRAVTALEEALLTIPHYFTTINEEGYGTLYDQLAVYHHGRRLAVTPPLSLRFQIAQTPQMPPQPLPIALSKRIDSWAIRLTGDYLDKLADTLLWIPLLTAERRSEITPFSSASIWQRCFVRPYRLLLQYILERYCFR